MGGFGSADPKASQRALLDQLMGAERDLDLESKARKKFWEKDVCKLYLVGLSPYKLLKETRGFVANGYDVWVKHAYAYALRLDCRPDDVAAAVKGLGGMGKPLNICLSQEVDRLQKVISVVRASLANLKLAIAGTIVMSPDLTNALDALFLARVPPM